jgi:diacylglycerol kinase
MTKNWVVTFKNAIEGCFYAFQTQKNFQVHFFLSFLVTVLAFWLKIPFERFLLLILAITFGLTMEMANTAFEKTVDLIIEKYHPKAKIAKDVSAGMMLIVSIGLAILGALILLPPLWQKLLG